MKKYSKEGDNTARPRQPIELVVAKGKKHLTKAEIELREKTELKVDKKPGARTKQIDPVDAVIDAHVTYMKFKEDIDVEAEMSNYLQAMGWHEK